MRKALLALGLLAVLAAACKKAESDSVIFVTVTAPANLPPVLQLHVDLTYGDRTQTELFPDPSSSTPIEFDATFVFTMPRVSTGSLGIVVYALNAGGKTVARGESAVAIVAGGRADVTIPLALVATTEPGTGGTVGTGGVVGTGGAAGRGGAVGTGGAVGAGGATSGTGGVSRTGGANGTGLVGQGGALGCPSVPSTSAVGFCNGQAQGAMTGWGWVALGELASLTSPVCDNTANGGGASEPISNQNPCPAAGGRTVWSAIDALCISGYIPIIVGGDYTSNWGIQVGWGAAEPPGPILGRPFTKVAFAWRGSIAPMNSAIRGLIHRSGDADSISYCATIQSGGPVALTAFNTRCWDNTGIFLTAEDVLKIDKMGVQVSSNDKQAFTVTDFCLTGVRFDSLPPGTDAGGP